MRDRLTKIVATVGPSSESAKDLSRLVDAGVNVFRLNFKHNTPEWHEELIHTIHAIGKKHKKNIATLIDLQGPNLRLKMPGDSLEVAIGDELLLDDAVMSGEKLGFTIVPNIIDDLDDGQRILAADGEFRFDVIKKKGAIYVKALDEGKLPNMRSINIPGSDFALPTLVARDLVGLALCAKAGVDFVALSFVRSLADITYMRKKMKKMGVTAKLVSKIETKLALENLDEIIDASDAIMVARGDLAIELSQEEVPYWQKIIIKKSLEYGKPVITATQMLQSMIYNPYPTRAEVSDLANAAYDRTDAVMLSGESAMGKHPHEAIAVMNRAISYNEREFAADTRLTHEYRVHSEEAMVCEMAYSMYLRLTAQGGSLRGFIVFTQEGKTARLLSRFRPLLPIFAFAPNRQVCNSLVLNFAVTPFVGQEVLEGAEVTQIDVRQAIEFVRKKGHVKKGDKLLVLHGDVWALHEGTTTVKILTVH